MNGDFGEARERLRSEYERLTHLMALVLDEGASERHDAAFKWKAELAAHFSEMQRRSALVRRTRDQLGEVERALEKLEQGTYGQCDCCGRAIPTARLEAIPQANLCLQCKARQVDNKAHATPHSGRCEPQL